MNETASADIRGAAMKEDEQGDSAQQKHSTDRHPHDQDLDQNLRDASGSEKLQLYIYRSEGRDDEGDFWDWGVLRARNIDDIKQSLRERVRSFMVEPLDHMRFRLAVFDDEGTEPGVLESAGWIFVDLGPASADPHNPAERADDGV